MDNQRSQGSSTRPRRAATETTLVGKAASQALSQAGSQVSASKPPETRYKHEWRYRRQTWLANALILFNAYGIPLSFGPYLEYYYNTWFPTASILELSLIVSFQFLCIFSMEYPGVLVANSKHWRKIFICVGLLVIGCQTANMWCRQWWLVLIVQGIIVGAGLGLLRAIARLHLATHYKNNIPLASMQSGAAGTLGALAYTGIALKFLYMMDSVNWACGLNFAVAAITIIPTFGLLHRSKLYRTENEHPKSIVSGSGSVWFLTGYLLLFSGLFVWPTFFILLMCSPPSNRWPQDAAYVLLVAFSLSIISAAYCTNKFARRYLGPVNAFVLFAIIAGLSFLNPAWMPHYWVLAGGSLGWGVSIGPILALHSKVVTVFYEGRRSYVAEMLPRITIVSVLIGFAAFAGIMSTAAMVHFTGSFEIPLTVYGGLMVLGGFLMMMGRFRKCKVYKTTI